MESSQLQQPRTQNLEYDEHHPSTVVEGEHVHHHGGVEDEHHHEHGAKGVIKKVKAKAKKIKETLTKHGHGHDDEEEEEEMVEDTEVHGAPIYDSHVTRPYGGWQEESSGHAPPATIPSATPWTSSGQEHPSRPVATPENTPSATPWMHGGQDMTSAAPATAHVPPPYHLPGEEGGRQHTWLSSGQGRTSAAATGHVPPLYAAAHVPGEEKEGGRQPTVRLGPLLHMDEDPQAPRDRPVPSNYESKVSDPTASGEEAEMGTLLQSMDKMRVADEAERHRKKEVAAPEGYTGSHDQFSPETNPHPKGYDLSNPEDMPRDTFTKPESTCTGKISSATSTITDKAIAAKNVVASKLGYGGEPGTDQSSVYDYGNKIASSVTGTLAPVYDKVAGVGSTVMSKVSGSGSGGDGAESAVGQDKGLDKGVSVKEYLVEKLRPGEEDQVLSEVITHSFFKKEYIEQPETEKGEKPMGKVTESVEVRERLGTDKDKAAEQKKDGGVSADSGAAGQAVVERIKGWFGVGSPNSQPSSGTILAGKKEEGRK